MADTAAERFDDDPVRDPQLPDCCGHQRNIAATAGQITGDYNVIYAPTPEVNYTYGTGDVSNSAGTGTYKAPLVELGQSWKWAGVIRQFLAPDGATSPLLGAGSATFTGNYPTVDWANRPRPSGGGSASASVGYSELHDFSVQDTVTYPTGQTSSAKMTGPGDTDIWVPVDAVSTTIAIQLYQGAGYTGNDLRDGDAGSPGRTWRRGAGRDVHQRDGLMADADLQRHLADEGGLRQGAHHVV